VNELNQQLFDLKGAYEELDAEKQRLGDELEKQASEVERDQAKQAIGKFLFFYAEHKDIKVVHFRKSTIRCIETTIQRGLYLHFVVDYLICLGFRFLFMPVVLMLRKTQKNFSSYEKM
jgi:hypothetical protein